MSSDEKTIQKEEATELGTLPEDSQTQKDFYLAALDYVKYEGQLFWQAFEALLLAHTVFLAFLLQAAFGTQQIPDFQLGTFLGGIVGFLLCIPWATVYSRSSAYYVFRIAQAKEKEPTGWELLKGAGERFSAGEKVQVGDRHYRIGWLGRVLKTQRSAPLVIVVFGLVYIGITVVCGPWW